MSQPTTGDTVRVHYTGTLQDGSVFDSSETGDPLEFTMGQGQLLPKFEQAVGGLEPGQSTEIDIPAAEAYGEYRDDLVIDLPRSTFPEEMTLRPTQQLQLSMQDGSVINATVLEANDDTVKIDANLPLAGKDLHFEIRLEEIAG